MKWPRWLDAASLAALFLALVALTWRRWPDALIDFWRNLYIPWRMSEGALLYVDVADWYGPLPHLVASGAFSLFGPGLDVLLALNGLVAAGCIVLVYAVLAHVGDRRSAWVGAAVFVLVFCCGQYGVLGNYNFMTPYVVQATWGFFGVLLVLEGALAIEREASTRAWLTAGLGLGVTWLTKAEAVLAAGVVIAVLTAMRRSLPKPAFLGGFALIGLPVALVLLVQGGPAFAWDSFHHAVTFPLQPNVRATLAAVPIFTTDLGTDAPLANALSHLGRGAFALGVLGALAAGARYAPRVAPALAVLGVGLVVALVDPLQLGRALLVPVLVTAALAFKTKRPGLALFALAALAMLARMLLNVRLYHYGFTMAVLATALMVHLAVFELPRLIPAPPRWLSWAGVALVLGLAGELTAHSLTMHGAKSAVVGSGRDTIFAFGPEAHRHPGIVNEALAAIATHAPGAKTVIAFPDSAAVSYLSRRPSPIPEFEFNPVSLGFSNEAEIIARLEANPPDAVVLTSYDLRSHGSLFFGGTPASGQTLASWVKQHYRIVASGPAGPFSVTGHAWDLLVRAK